MFFKFNSKKEKRKKKFFLKNGLSTSIPLEVNWDSIWSFFFFIISSNYNNIFPTIKICKYKYIYIYLVLILMLSLVRLIFKPQESLCPFFKNKKQKEEKKKKKRKKQSIYIVKAVSFWVLMMTSLLLV